MEVTHLDNSHLMTVDGEDEVGVASHRYKTETIPNGSESVMKIVGYSRATRTLCPTRRLSQQGETRVHLMKQLSVRTFADHEMLGHTAVATKAVDERRCRGSRCDL